MKKQYEIYPRKYSVIILTAPKNIIQVWDKIVIWRNNLKIKVEFLQNFNPTINLYHLVENSFLLILDNVSSINVRKTFADVLIDLQNSEIIIIKCASITWPSINKVENFNLKHFEDVKIILSMNDWERNYVLVNKYLSYEFADISIKPHLKSLNILTEDIGSINSEKLRANLLDTWNNEIPPIYPSEVLPDSEYTVTEVNSNKRSSESQSGSIGMPSKHRKYYCLVL